MRFSRGQLHGCFRIGLSAKRQVAPRPRLANLRFDIDANPFYKIYIDSGRVLPEIVSPGRPIGDGGAFLLSIPRITVVGSYAAGQTLKVRVPSPGETVLASGHRID